MTTTSAAKPRTYTSNEPGNAEINCFFESQTSTWQYVISDPATLQAVLVDTVLDYDPAAGKVSTESADQLLAFIKKKNLKVLRILETHAHADHLTAAQYLKSKLPGDVPVCIGSRITQVQSNFAPVYGLEWSTFGETFDIFLKDDEEFPVGNLTCRVIHLPGHTPDHIGYAIGKAVFTGDSIFLPDVGSARVDFPGGDAKQLYASMNRLLSLPEDYKLFVGHDYPSCRNYNCVTTVGEQRKLNKHGKVGTTEEAFIHFRKQRDDTLGAPRLIHPSLQVNIRAGRLPPADTEGRVWMKIPVKYTSDVEFSEC
ncbi:Metallo-hydrolase/oxidoreductase [Guyanagaster necrorhizus]|uniref:Metallo-hydrolase/oxidoreductase n=1 Tax=Guyanagaster necrorhizus TaxID=856835 RepID=A0A9P7VZD1_9AGAR|nr:Metallo-hydrolase/oxidoreductase [Guyanagaster necrorhizus MCA 3950]KAG7449545.1 Metallo-hydrolase/oxidoreductase [Guyanagaster necrorhizus MCA 3950]